MTNEHLGKNPQHLSSIKTQQELTSKVFNALNEIFEYYIESEEFEDENVADIIAVAGGAPRDWYLGNPARDVDMYVRVEDYKELIKKFAFIPEDKKAFNAVEWQYTTETIRDYFEFKDLKKTTQDYYKLKHVSPILEKFGDLLIQKGILFTKLIDKSIESPYLDPAANNAISAVFEMEYKGQAFDIIFVADNNLCEVLNESTGKTNLHTVKEQIDIYGVSFGEVVIGTYDFNICRIFYDVESNVLNPSKYFLEDINKKNLTLRPINDKRTLYRAIYKHYPKLKKKFPGFVFELHNDEEFLNSVKEYNAK